MAVQAPDHKKLQSFADAICKRGFGMPVLFFLEMYKPLSNVVGVLGEGFHPILGALFGKEKTGEVLALLQDRDLFNDFLDMIEENLKSPQERRAVDGS
jgi:hypothetical protein